MRSTKGRLQMTAFLQGLSYEFEEVDFADDIKIAP